jgi:hypothetical protein
MEDFTVIDNGEILSEIFQEWLHNPEFKKSELYFGFLKYRNNSLTEEDIKKWKDDVFLKNLNDTASVNELHDTLDQMDELNELVIQLDQFNQMILNEIEIKKTRDNLLLDMQDKVTFKQPSHIPFYDINYDLLNFKDNFVVQRINSWFHIFYDYTVFLVENMF